MGFRPIAIIIELTVKHRASLVDVFALLSVLFPISLSTLSILAGLLFSDNLLAYLIRHCVNKHF